ncbi:TetR/AcrR family transcriptional regulator [Paraburkholderia sp. BR10937]|uniref:TetR/AcrR family transcriptional regulator n=1 Tax=Paraburkholderia sp. BR10937 TaxID=3236994 RepID=UPI0034D32A7A
MPESPDTKGSRGSLPLTGANVRAAVVVEAAPVGRRPGRPVGGVTGAMQRARLLDVALVLFARHGILDTSLAAIARAAGVTPAMVHYYFRTRDQLLDVLIDERFVPLRAMLGGAFEDNPDDPVSAITELARRLVNVAREHPWFPTLWVREVISEGGILQQRMHERFGDEHQRKSLKCIRRWQEEGRLNADLEPSLVFLSLLGLTLLPLATSKMWRNESHRASLTPDDIARHAIALLVRGIRA